MTQTKKIYFLSALVLIIGCYALNLSYSLFVQKEEKNVLDSSVVGLSYKMDQNVFYIDALSTKLIKVVVTNTSSTSMNYGILAKGNVDNYKIRIVNNNLSYGNLESNESKELYLAVTNDSNNCMTVNLALDYTYSTINFDTEAYLSTSNIDNENSYEYSFSNTLKDKIIKSATNNIDTIKSTLLEESLTNLGDINNIDEKNLIKTQDNYGESYYYRGNVKDNYMTYMNECYRIVNIDGNGNIKLLLESSSPCSKDMNLDTAYIGKTTFGDNNLYQSSNIKTILETWFNSHNISQDEIILNKWCIDTYDENNLNLKCENELDGYVGTLTAKEIILAGFSLDSNNTNQYFGNTNNWWTITPNLDNRIYVAYKTLEEKSIDEEYFVRPSIVIKGSISVQGTGTIEDPYRIDEMLSNKTFC